MVRQRTDSRTGDLLGWEPPRPVARFPAESVRAATLASKVAKAMALALKGCGKCREHVAREMSAYLGETVSLAMLNAYVSEARTSHAISMPRFAALVHATQDLRLLAILPELFGCAVIDERFLPAIEDAVLDDKIEELTQRKKMARKRWKGASP